MQTMLWLQPWQRNEEFPITRSKVFLAHAAASPLPRRVCQAITELCQRCSMEGQWEYLYGALETGVRRNTASLLGVTEEEIALVSSTSMGLATVARGIPWRNGDNVVVAGNDFPANVYPWLWLRDAGVQTKFIRSCCGIGLGDVIKSLDSHTRLVSLSSVDYISGHRADLNSIGAYLHGRGIYFCVDAVQSLGALPFDATYVDFAAASAHKWLLGPMGIGVLYVRKSLLDMLKPTLVGWKTVRENKDYLSYDLTFPDSAKRYEMGTLNALGIAGLHAALALLNEVGIENIASRILRLTGRLARSLRESGFEVLSPLAAEKGSGIVSFTSDRLDIARMRGELDAQGFVVSLRDMPDGRKCIRVAPHFYNSDDEIAAFSERATTYSPGLPAMK